MKSLPFSLLFLTLPLLVCLLLLSTSYSYVTAQFCRNGVDWRSNYCYNFDCPTAETTCTGTPTGCTSLDFPKACTASKSCCSGYQMVSPSNICAGCTKIPNFCTASLPYTSTTTTIPAASTVVDSVITITCINGTLCNGTCSNSTCLPSQSWSVQCIPILNWCSSTLPNGSLSTSSPASNIVTSTATLSCDIGYTCSGGSGGSGFTCSAVCSTDSTWSKSCSLIPNFCPNSVSNGILTTTVFNYKAVATLTCSTGAFCASSNYTSSSCVVSCNATAAWNDTCIFAPNWCSSTIANGTLDSFTPPSLAIASIGSISCKTGYQCKNSVCTGTCQASHQWSQSCVPIENWCSPIDNGSVDANNLIPANNIINATAVLTCNTAYHCSSGDCQSTLCQTNRTWSQTCSPISNWCPTSVHNGNIISTAPVGNNYGVTATGQLVCNTGYQCSGNCFPICQLSHEWTQTCVPITNWCPASSALGSHAAPSTPSNNVLGSTVTWSCSIGASCNGSCSSSTCTIGRYWSTQCVYVPNWCPSQVHYGAISSTTPPNNVVSSTTTLTCDSGFSCSISGCNTQCQANKDWTNKCLLNSCTSPSVSFAQVYLYSNPNAFEVTAKIACSTGYSLAGNTFEKYLKCQGTVGNYAWNSSVPAACLQIQDYCQEPAIPHGSYTTTPTSATYTFGSNVVFNISCNSGYNLTSPGVIYTGCQFKNSSKGEWNVTFPRCVERVVDSESSSPVAAVGGAVGGAIFLVLLAILFIVFKRKREAQKVDLEPSGSSLEMVGSSSVTPDEAEGIHNRTYSQVYASTSRNSHYSSIPNNSAEMDHYYAETSLKSQFLRQSIELKKELGNGNFGVVYSASLSSSFVKAVAPDIYSASSITESTVTVAVKVLKSTTNAKAQSDFEAEINIMRHFKHPNIVRMLATLVEEQPFMLVLEFLPYGDLKGVLVYSALRSITWYESEFLFVLAQLADALAYLAANRFVHRDIAARNCLVGKDLNVKISDFGLSRVLDEEKDYYKLQTKGQMPIKWMAPESLNFRKFTAQSDMWSFGVLCWEIFSYGQPPYGNLKGPEVLSYVESGKRLEKPENCSDSLFATIQKCWDIDPSKRPTAADCTDLFKNVQTNSPPVRDLGLIISRLK